MNNKVKLYILGGVFTSLLATNVFAEFRLGALGSNTEFKGVSSDESSYGIDVGYDINRVIGLKGSYEFGDDRDYYQVGADLGYTFGGNLQIKPYVAANLIGLTSDEGSNSGFAPSIGIRVSLNSLYADLSHTMEAEVDDALDNSDYSRTSLSLGLKF